jgi:protein-L-isoaspartate(D-aspartate) O-methyltransferase
MVSSETRKRYADEIRVSTGILSEALVRAFAVVPREEFVGPRPWKVLSKAAPGQLKPQVAEVTEPAELYQDAAIFLDPTKMLTNGNPGTLAPWLDALQLAEGHSVFHLGCGTGYYTAVMAEVVGPSGRVTAVEVERVLAVQARASLARYPQVEVIEGDGGVMETGPRQAILINAGVTHPTEEWLNSLADGGNLVLPMTVEFGMPHIGKGFPLLVTRRGSQYAARFLRGPVVIYSCTSVRDQNVGTGFWQQTMSGTFSSVQSLRRDAHTAETTCWLHCTTFCLSTLPVQ